MKKILIAEDDNFIANVYKMKLENEGFEIRIVGNGEEALHQLEHFTPDVILLDLIMPVKNGFDTLAEIRKMQKFDKTPVIIATNLSQPEDTTKAKELGADDFIIKSQIRIDDLVARIHAIASK